MMSTAASRDFDKLWNYDDPAGTESAFRDMLPSVEDRETRTQLKTQIARTLGLQRKFDAAHALLDEVERELTPELRVARVRYLLERGRVFNSSGKPDRAKPLFLEAVEVGTDAKLDGYVVDAVHMLAIVEPEASAQHDWNCRAMALAESSADPTARRWLATLYNNIGWTYYDQKRYDDALDVFRKAIPLREQAGKVGPLRIAHYCVGKTLRAMGELDDALVIQRRLDAEHHANGTPDGFVCEEIAECLLLKGRPDEAKDYFRHAYEVLSKDQWLMQNEPQRVERLRQLAGDGSSAR
jgi:tetratricopeptide (TPR) repeat protein